MRLSELTESTELPVGVHRASLRETLVRFAVGHAQRVAVGQRLERIYHVAAEDGASSRKRGQALNIKFTANSAGGVFVLRRGEIPGG